MESAPEPQPAPEAIGEEPVAETAQVEDVEVAEAAAPKALPPGKAAAAASADAPTTKLRRDNPNVLSLSSLIETPFRRCRFESKTRFQTVGRSSREDWSSKIDRSKEGEPPSA